jgi:hypothetical protein
MKYGLLLLTAFFQTTCFGQWEIGVQGMVNFCSAEVFTSGNDIKSWRFKPGFGVVSEIDLSKNLKLRPSINFLGKGTRITNKPNGRNRGYMNEINFSFLEIPVVGTFNFSLKNARAFVGIGPSLGIGITGKSKITTTSYITEPNTTTTVDLFRKINSIYGSDHYKRIEMSCILVAGVQFANKLFINAGALFGFTNLHSYYKNYGLQLTLGYFMWTEK